MNEALALSEADLNAGRGYSPVRRGKGGRRREVGTDDWGWQQIQPWLAAVITRLEARASPYFALAAVLALVAVILLHGTASAVLECLAFLTLLGACVRAASLAVRDDDVSSATIRGPAGRTLGIMGADSRSAQRRRRRRRWETAGGDR
jgi:hypothetical protein